MKTKRFYLYAAFAVLVLGPVAVYSDVFGDLLKAKIDRTTANETTIRESRTTRFSNSVDNVLLGTLEVESTNTATADNDGFNFDFDALDDGGNSTIYTRDRAVLLDVTGGTEDGAREIWVQVAGTLTKIGTFNASGLQIVGSLTTTGSITPVARNHVYSIIGAKVGATAGWTVDAGADTFIQTCPASQTSATLIIPIGRIPASGTISNFGIMGRVESAGGAVTVDANLRKQVDTAGAITDSSVASITQISKTADYLISDAAGWAGEVVSSNKSFYILVTATTAASTSVELTGYTLTMND